VLDAIEPLLFGSGDQSIVDEEISAAGQPAYGLYLTLDTRFAVTVPNDAQRAALVVTAMETTHGFTPANVRKIQAESPILTQTIRINFFPNSANPYELARDKFGNMIAGKLYDPGVDATLEQVARLAGQFERAVVLVEGHTDSSMKGRAPYDAVKQLSQERADAVKQALIEKFKFDPNKFAVKGCAWDKPFSQSDPKNHPLNRRVEISVYPPEQ